MENYDLRQDLSAKKYFGSMNTEKIKETRKRATNKITEKTDVAVCSMIQAVIMILQQFMPARLE